MIQFKFRILEIVNKFVPFCHIDCERKYDRQKLVDAFYELMEKEIAEKKKKE